MKKAFWALFLAVCLLMSGAAAEENDRGFESPESCAQAVAQALADGDAQALLACYAIPEVARCFDLGAYAKEYQLIVRETMLLEPSSGFNIAFNESRMTQWVMERYNAASGMLGEQAETIHETYNKGLFEWETTPEEMLGLTDTSANLTRLRFKGVSQLEDVVELSGERYQKLLQRNLTAYSLAGLPSMEVVAVLDLDGREVYLPLLLTQFDGGWLIVPIVPTCMHFLDIPDRYALYPKDLL